MIANAPMGLKTTALSLILAVSTPLIALNANASSSVTDALETAYARQDYTTLRTLLTPMAEAGDPTAQTNLAKLFQDGLGTAQNHKTAAEWYEKAAVQDYPDAQHALGNLYATGLGVAQDYEQAERWFRRAATADFASAQHALGLIMEQELTPSADPSEAALWYGKAAEQGSAEGQTALGVLFQSGQFVTQDYSKARELYELAAAQNHPSAQNNLGILYTRGLGVDQDYAEAAKWYAMAAEGGSKQAMTNLGVLYDNGFGVPQSDEIAIAWYRKAGRAARPARDPSTNRVETEYARMPITSLTRLAEAGDGDAQFDLGLRYKTGRNVPQDYVYAYYWLNASVQAGREGALQSRGDLVKVMTSAQINTAQSLNLMSR